MRIRLAWWHFPMDTLTFVLIGIPWIVFAYYADGALWFALMAGLFLVALLQSRTTGWTVTPDAVRVHPGPLRRSVAIPWADVQGVVVDCGSTGRNLAFWTGRGLEPQRLSRGPNLGRHSGERIRSRVEQEWIARRGQEWQPLPGSWNAEA